VYPKHNEIALGIECKAHANFDKSIVKEVLGVRRELSLLTNKVPSILTQCGGSPLEEVRADPSSEYWLTYKPGQVDVESDIDEMLEFDGQDLVVPAGLFRKAIIRKDVGPLVGFTRRTPVPRSQTSQFLSELPAKLRMASVQFFETS